MIADSTVDVTTEWRLVIGQDAARVKTWQQIAPFVSRDFPGIFGGGTGQAHVETAIHLDGQRPTATITITVTGGMGADDRAQAFVRAELVGVFLPRVFGPRAELLALTASVKKNYRMLARPLGVGATGGTIQ